MNVAKVFWRIWFINDPSYDLKIVEIFFYASRLFTLLDSYNIELASFEQIF